MRIAFLSCFYPYRGGISQFSGCLLKELGGEHITRAFNFRRQYPEFLFPGKTQYVTPGDEACPVESSRVLDSVNPFTWRSTARQILAWKPDLVLISWWMGFFGPSLGEVAHVLRRHGVKVVSILHNVIPHEPRFWDKPLTKWFLGACSGHVTLSEDVQKSLNSLGPYNSILLFHPIYNQFGSTIPRADAERMLKLEPGKKNLLFFGLIRKYKGLDILIRAFNMLPEDYQLIISGEPYGGFEEYRQMIESSPAKSRIHCFPDYVRDSEVKKFFSAADLSVLPYRSATQSGVRAVSYNFGVPMVVTDVGSLKADIADTGTGLAAPAAEPDLIASEIEKFFGTPGLQEQCRDNIKRELGRLGWGSFSKALLNYTTEL